MDKRQEFVDIIISAFRAEIVKKLVFSRPVGEGAQKISGREVAHRGRRILALEYSLPGDTVSQKNVKEEDIPEVLAELIPGYNQVNLLTTLGDVEWKISKSGKTALLGIDRLARKLSGDVPNFATAIEALDKKKNYILTGGEDFLIALGVSDARGRVHDKRQGKFRQINRFLLHIEDIYGELPKDGEILVYDLCCGKSYLSFAVYHYLTKVKGRVVKMLGIDLKRDVIDWCSQTANSLGYQGMKFICDDIKNTPAGEVPDMVISLHACDVATDIVLSSAARLGAKVILSTPCCHRYMNGKVAVPELEFVTRFPHLSNKLSEALTDALRLLRLEEAGYKVSALELTDPDDTPKNTLIRAIKITDEKNVGAYRATLEYLLGDEADGYLKGM